MRLVAVLLLMTPGLALAGSTPPGPPPPRLSLDAWEVQARASVHRQATPRKKVPPAKRTRAPSEGSAPAPVTAVVPVKPTQWPGGIAPSAVVADAYAALAWPRWPPHEVASIPTDQPSRGIAAVIAAVSVLFILACAAIMWWGHRQPWPDPRRDARPRHITIVDFRDRRRRVA